MSRIVIYQGPFRDTCMGFANGAEYKIVWQETTEQPLDIDQVWERFQRVDPDTGPWVPAGFFGRSLSIGDVVALDGRYWTPMHVGWTELEPIDSCTLPADQVLAWTGRESDSWKIEHPSLEAAEEWIRHQEEVDPEGVEAGLYYIDSTPALVELAWPSQERS